jgi:DNA polymerase-3 subunit alpha
VAGSIVAYCLAITDVDPLRYDLLFERFLNPERVSMPDIDIDFSVRGRERVMRYVTERYGRESVAQIVTFGKMFPRAATRDAARVLGFDYGAGDRLAKLIPDPVMGRAPSFEDCLKVGQPLRSAYDEEPDARRIVDVARGLEGIARNSSIHAAAVVIAEGPLTDIVPLQLADSGAGEDGQRAFRTVTQYSMKPIEDIGLLKMDFLGLRNLDVIEDALDIIERSTGQRPDMTNLPLDDARTYQMLARGDSTGVFQFESEGMREALKKVRPDEFNDLVALNALYRPGAMDQIPLYAKGKHDPQAISYPDERLRPILEPSKGVILYQEQAMQIATELAGFSGAKADDLRKAIGKKDRAAMAALRPEFIEGARASGTSARVIEFLWQTNERSADYSYNKSHATCYAMIAYRTAWLKANHTAQYMAALISSVMSTKDKVPFFVARCEEMSIEILPPDVNLSDHKFTVEATTSAHENAPRTGSNPNLARGRASQNGQGNIRFGLDAVKGVGYQAVEAIKRARGQGGEFVSLWDFCERVDGRVVNKKAIEALIKCGAFGSTGATRKGMLAVLEQAQAAGQKMQQDALIGQGSIFDLGAEIAAAPPAGVPTGGAGGRSEASRSQPTRQGNGAALPGNGLARPSHPPIPGEEFDQSELLAAEKEAIGLFVSAHPLKPLRRALKARVDCSLASLEDRRDKDLVTVGGIIVEAKRIRTRNGEPMMFATLDDLAGTVELLVFGKALGEHEAALKVDAVVVVKGRVDHKEAGKTCLVVQSAESFTPSQAELERAQTTERSSDGLGIQQPVRIHVDAADLSAGAIDELKRAIRECPGSAEVLLDIETGAGTRRLRLGEAYRVQHSTTLMTRLENALMSTASAAASA